MSRRRERGTGMVVRRDCIDVRTVGVGWDVGGRAIVDSVTTALRPGTITAIVGPNGSGKTTLLHLIGGIRRPARGSIRYDGRDLAGLGNRARAREVALVEQHPDTALDLTVREVVALGRIPHAGRWPGSPDPGRDAVEDAMRVSDIVQLADRGWAGLSGGERQRTQLARALAQRPRLLLLDEPTNHLDLRHQLELLETVTKLGLTTVAVLHDLDLAAAFCPRLLVMADGRVVADGDTDDILDSRLVADVFGVRATVTRSDRIRVAWSGTTSGPMKGNSG